MSALNFWSDLWNPVSKIVNVEGRGGVSLSGGAEALKLYQAGRFREAESLLLQIEAPDPDHLNLLAQVRMGRGNWSGALQALEQVDAFFRNAPRHRVLRGNVYKELDRFEEALEDYDQALLIDPDCVPGLTNRAGLQLLMGRLPKAEADLARALTLMPGFADARFHLGGLCLQRGDFEMGWRLYESRLETSLCSGLAKAYPAERHWSGSPYELVHRRLLVYGEQGLGDMIQFSRFLPMLMSMRIEVILQIPKSLHRLFVQVWPELELVDLRDPYTGTFDRHCSLVSLPFLLGLKSPFSLPWMHKIQPVIGRSPQQKPRVGLVWSGLPVRDLERYRSTRRSMSLAALAPILTGDVNFVSLQTHARAEDRVLMIQFGIEDVSERLTDFYETAVLMKTLDLVISIDTSVIHLAGALGVPAWVILPQVTDYRWSGTSEGSAWYPDVRIFRQEKAGDWAAPVAEMAAAIR